MNLAIDGFRKGRRPKKESTYLNLHTSRSVPKESTAITIASVRSLAHSATNESAKFVALKQNQRTKTTQTKRNVVESLLSRNTKMEKYAKVLEQILSVSKFTLKYIPDDATMRFLTGLTKAEFKSFYKLFDFGGYNKVKSVDTFTQILILCLYLKTGATQNTLADIFHITSNLTARILYRMTEEIYGQLKAKYMFLWTSTESRKTDDSRNLSERETNSDKSETDNNPTVIVDCVEILTHASKQTATCHKLQNTWKNSTSVKALLAVSPSGEITFISDVCGSILTDTEVFLNSGFLPTLEPGTHVIADDSFDIDDELLEFDCFRTKPDLSSFLCKTQIELVFQKIRTFKYFEDLNFTNKLNFLNKYFYVTVFIVNFSNFIDKNK